MDTKTRKLFNQMKADIAEINGVDNVGESFSATPSVQQTLENHIQHSSEFLTRISINLVPELAGEKIGLGITSTIASTTDTNTTDRVPFDPTDTDAKGYFCQAIDYDTAIKYSKIDQWAKFKDFVVKYRDAILKRQALDRIMIGWNGTSRAATSNRTTNPLLQDVAKGWVQKVREATPARIISQIGSTGKIQIGDAVTGAAGYKNLDALVFDIVGNLIDPWHRESPDLVVLLGSDLMADKYFPLINKAQENTEKIAADMIISQKRVGGKPAVTVPFFPANKIVVTSLENLAIYIQEGSRRRTIIDNPKRKQIEDYQSSNDDYIVEDHGMFCCAENIEIVA